jgi:ATP synthase protein I
MRDQRPTKPPTKKTAYSDQVGAQADRKIRARRRGEPSIWVGFGMAGMIGWSVTVPVVAFALLGLWLDKHYPGPHSWTLALLAAGLVLGCWNAWRWVDKQDKAMREEQEDKDE